MYLQKLEIQGFKSFANKTTLEFNRQLTAVVGPNGSGKSNIADAIRWVLGEQSLKLLRGKKAEDVIFAGSDLKGRLGMAEVSLYLNNEDGQAPIDFFEIIVTRRVFRDGQSEYLLNQSPVRLQDIQLLLARSNFGQKTYSVIGQGMIDSILLASPAERKEFFEEATGVKQYQIKRDQAIQKITTTYENLEQAEAVVQEIEPRLRALTRQVKRLERREELERELWEMQKLYFRARWHELEGRRQEVKNKTTEHGGQLAKQKKITRELEFKLKELEGAELVSKHWHELQSKQTELRNKLSHLLKEQAVAQAEEEIGHLKRGEGEVAWLKQRLAEIEVEQKNLTARVQAVDSELSNKQESLQNKLAEQTRVMEGFDSLTSESGDKWLINEINSLAQEQSDFRRHLVQIKNLAEVQSVVQRASVIEDRLRSLLKRLEQGGRLSTAELNRALRERDTLVNEVAGLQASLKSLQREQENLTEAQNRLRETKDKIEHSLSGTVKSTSPRLPEISKNITEVEKKLGQAEHELNSFQAQAETRKAEFFAVQRELTATTGVERRLEQEAHELAVNLARLETKLEDLEREMAQEVPPELVHEIKAPGTVTAIDEGGVALELQKLKHQLELTGGIEPEVVTEYQQTKTRYDFINNQLADLKTAIGSLEGVIRDLDETIQKKFLLSFKAINEKFSKYFQLLFSGGKAQLVLQKEESTKEPEAGDEEVELIEGEESPKLGMKDKFLQQERLKASLFSGVEMSATPPGKKLSSINALSGGEKALTSIALICAIISNNPSPFVTLDEVDAALDEANSERFAAILDTLMNETQFITITHNRATMKKAAILYGVTMGEDGVSKLLSVKLDEAKEMVGKPKK